jgi:hypothetical protein
VADPVEYMGRGMWRQNEFAACPSCGARHDAWRHACTTPHQGKPKSGDCSVCVNCACVNVIEVSPLGLVSLREATTAELVKFSRDPQITNAVRAANEFIARHSGP